MQPFFFYYGDFLFCGSAGKTEEDTHCCAAQGIFEKFGGSRYLGERVQVRPSCGRHI